MAPLKAASKAAVPGFNIPWLAAALAATWAKLVFPPGNPLSWLIEVPPVIMWGAALRATDEYFKLAKDNGMSLTQMALAFVNSRPFVTSNIIGATTMEQLKENIDSVDIELSNKIVEKINLIHANNPNPTP